MKPKETFKDDVLRPEYNLKILLKDGVQGKYAEKYKEETNIILLAPDVAVVFSTEESVNEALRLVIKLSKIHSRARKSSA
ncbi:hypothetical protein JW824_02390 [bacterium]|nr:hypothetical protein [bacterium]RQV93255.1 MAG: hypothetical protein EH221_09785 [bacterium]